MKTREAIKKSETPCTNMNLKYCLHRLPRKHITTDAALAIVIWVVGLTSGSASDASGPSREGATCIWPGPAPPPGKHASKLFFTKNNGANVRIDYQLVNIPDNLNL